MENGSVDPRIIDIANRLDAIVEELTDVSVDLLREAVEAGQGQRPVMDKKLSQARRAVEKAARALRPDSQSWPGQS